MYYNLTGFVWEMNLGKYKDTVWNKDSPHFQEFRLDIYDKWMKYSEYGKRPNEYAWEVDHILARKDGGTDVITNFRALNWRSNVARNGHTVNQTEK